MLKLAIFDNFGNFGNFVNFVNFGNFGNSHFWLFLEKTERSGSQLPSHTLPTPLQSWGEAPNARPTNLHLSLLSRHFWILGPYENWYFWQVFCVI